MAVWYRAGILCGLFCGMFLLIGLFSSCRSLRTDPLAACKKPFAAKVEGELNGIPFAAEITVTAERKKIVFSSPEILSGCELTVMGEEVVLSRNGKEINVSEGAMRGLMRPLSVLTEAKGSPERVEKQGDQYAVTFADDVSFTVSDRGLPRFVSFPGGSFRVVDFASL